MESHVEAVLPDIIETLRSMYPLVDHVDRSRLGNALRDFIMFAIFPWNFNDDNAVNSRTQYAVGYFDFIDIWKAISPMEDVQDSIIADIDATANIKNICTWVLFNFHPQ